MAIELNARGFKHRQVGREEMFILNTSREPSPYGVATTMEHRTSVEKIEDPEGREVQVILGSSRDHYCYQLHDRNLEPLLPEWPIRIQAVGGFPSEEKALQHARRLLEAEQKGEITLSRHGESDEES